MFVCIVGRQVSLRHVTPSIIGVSSYFCSAGVVYRNYVALQIFLEVIRYEIIECITLSRRVVYAYWTSIFVIDKDENVVIPSLRNNPVSVEQVLILCSQISRLTRSYSVRIDYNITLSRVTFLLYCIFDTLSREFVHICHNVVRSTKRKPPLATVALLPPMWQRLNPKPSPAGAVPRNEAEEESKKKQNEVT